MFVGALLLGVVVGAASPNPLWGVASFSAVLIIDHWVDNITATIRDAAIHVGTPES